MLNKLPFEDFLGQIEANSSNIGPALAKRILSNNDDPIIEEVMDEQPPSSIEADSYDSDINSIERLRQFAAALAKNTFLTSINESFYGLNPNDDDEAKPFINFIQNILKRNAVVKQLKETEQLLVNKTDQSNHLLPRAEIDGLKLKIKSLKEDISKQNEAIIESATDLITGEANDSIVKEKLASILKIYSNLIETKQYLKILNQLENTLEELKSTMPDNKEISDILNQLYVSRNPEGISESSRPKTPTYKRFKELKHTPKDSPYYAKAMVECGRYALAMKDDKQVKVFFENAAAVKDPEQKKWVDFAFEKLLQSSRVELFDSFEEYVSEIILPGELTSTIDEISSSIVYGGKLSILEDSESTSPSLSSSNITFYTDIAVDSIEKCYQFAAAIAGNTSFTPAHKINILRIAGKHENVSDFTKFIDKTLERNALVNELNAAKTTQALLNAHSNFGSNLINSLEKMPLNLITGEAFAFSKILSYVIGCEWVFDLYRFMQRSPEKQNEADAFQVPLIEISITYLNRFPLNLFKFKMGTFAYPKHPISLLLPLHYVAMHLGYLIGVITALPVALFLLPVAFIKAGIDTFIAKKEVQTKIESLEARIPKQNEAIIELALNLITEEDIKPDLESQEKIKYVLDLYGNLIKAEQHDKFILQIEDKLNDFQNKMPDDTNVSFILGQSQLHRFYKDKSKKDAGKLGFNNLKDLPEDSPHYAEGMLECGLYKLEINEKKEAEEFFEKAAAVQDKKQKNWVKKASEELIKITPGGAEYLEGLKAFHDAKYFQAKEHFEKAAQAKYPAAYLWLGQLYNNDDFIGPKNEAISKEWHVKIKEHETINWFHEQAQTGQADAQFNLGWCYEFGIGVKKDPVEAVKYFKQAARQGYVDAQFRLGLFYQYGAGVKKDMQKAIQFYQRAANQGYAAAQCNLGWCYDHGEGVKQDKEKAVHYFHLAADQGYTTAQFNLGVCYYNGKGVKENKKEAVRYYRLAADQGDANAQCSLGFCYQYGEGVKENKKESVRYYRLAADQGEARAQCNLGWCYDNGKGIKQDRQEAVRYYRLAAEHRIVEAQFNLGVRYANGEGVQKDEQEELRYYLLAANQNHVLAKNKLKTLLEKNPQLKGAEVYFKGLTAFRDAKYSQAKTYFEEAAALNYPAAYLWLGRLYNNDDFIRPKNEDMSKKWYEKAKESENTTWFYEQAQTGRSDAQFNLGQCYNLGIGVEEDEAEAFKYYKLAADQGNADAQFSLGLCYEQGAGVHKDEQEAMRYYQLAANQNYVLAKNQLKELFKEHPYLKGAEAYFKGVKAFHHAKYLQAKAYFEEAAQEKYPSAYLWLGRLYQNEGYIGPKNEAMSKEWYEKAKEPEIINWFHEQAQTDRADAKFNLGWCYDFVIGVDKDKEQAFKYFERAAEQGNADAQFYLGACYDNGKGVNEDKKEAVHYYQLAADQGLSIAQCNLGTCYYNGEGVKQDMQKAVHYYQLAADQGYATTQYNLGLCYDNGEGMKQDKQKAVHYYQLAADQGLSIAQCNLGTCYYNGEGVKENQEKALHYFHLAADQEDAAARFNLGLCYQLGKGVKQNNKEAVHYYRLAAAQNYERAKNNLEELLKKHPDLEQETEILDAQNKSLKEKPVDNGEEKDSKTKFGPLFNPEANPSDIIVKDPLTENKIIKQ